jgi:hypothetical protein
MSPRRFVGTTPAALVTVFLVTVCGCATSSEPASVHVKNDTSQSVTLAVCGSRNCAKRLDPWNLRPGQSGAINVEIDGGYGPAILLGPNGAPIGCLPFRMSKRPPQGFTVSVSRAVACGRSGGAGVADGRDWPDPSL